MDRRWASETASCTINGSMCQRDSRCVAIYSLHRFVYQARNSS